MKKAAVFLILFSVAFCMMGTKVCAAGKKTTTKTGTYSNLIGTSEVSYNNIIFQAGVKNKTNATKYARVYLKVYKADGSLQIQKSAANITSAGATRNTAAAKVLGRCTARCNSVIHGGTSVSAREIEALSYIKIKK